MARSFDCINFKDVSDEFPTQIHHGILFRGGDISFCSHTDVQSPRTVINLRYESDSARWENVQYLHFPIANRIEKYDTSIAEVRDWLIEILLCLAECPLPVLIHCLSGKDRTGVVVSCLLRILLGSERDEDIVRYYLEVAGTRKEWIQQSMAGWNGKLQKSENWITRYFRKKITVTTVDRLKDRFCLSDDGK
jgi:protein-tyrosine phosphatase